jgi:hypothetical protein
VKLCDIVSDTDQLPGCALRQTAWGRRVQTWFLDAGVEMTVERAKAMQPGWRGWVMLLGGFLGLCTIFTFLVTAFEAWQEHAQTQWPKVTASIESCGIRVSRRGYSGPYDSRGGNYYISCHIRYQVGAEETVANIYSTSTRAPNLLNRQDPWATVRELQAWVDTHPPGTPIRVHYHPDHHQKAVLVATDMPLGGPRTPGNLKLLGFTAAACAALLAIARPARPS